MSPQQLSRPRQALLHDQRVRRLRRARLRQRHPRARPEAAAGALQPGAPPRRARPRPRACRRSAPAAKPGTQVGLAENMTICVPVIETPEHIAGRRARHARAERRVPDGDPWRATTPTPTSRRRRRRAEVHARGPEDHREPARFRRASTSTRRLYVRADDAAAGLRRWCRIRRRIPHMASPWLTHRPRGALLGAAPRRPTIWNVEGDLHHRERLLRRPTCPPPTARSTTPTA